jgi:ribosomal protein S6
VETAVRAYEVMVILDPSLEERTIEPSLDKYLNVIRKDGGSVENVDVWGRRRLAYEIKKNAEGIYAVINADGRAGDGQGVRPPAQAQRVDPAHQGDASRRPLSPGLWIGRWRLSVPPTTMSPRRTSNT